MSAACLLSYLLLQLLQLPPLGFQPLLQFPDPLEVKQNPSAGVKMQSAGGRHR